MAFTPRALTAELIRAARSFPAVILTGPRRSGKNPATAHLFIMKPLSVSGALALFSTHPPTEERIQRLLQPA